MAIMTFTHSGPTMHQAATVRTVTSQPGKAASGFTLIELLVVLAIMALLLILAIPSITAVLPNMELKSNAREVAASLREARSIAISTDQDAVFTIDVDRKVYFVSGQRQSHSLRGDVSVTLYTAQEEHVGGSTGSIRFFPDGSSTGGSVKLVRGTLGYRVTVDWLTGVIEILDN
jgi:general secretion pathway protein H